MKKILKLINNFFLTIISIINIIACNNKNNQMNSKDILNTAAFIHDSNLNIKSDLNLSDNIDMKAMVGKTFSELNNSSKLNKNIQNAINNFFSNKLKENTTENRTNWYHNNVNIKIMDYIPKKNNDENEKNKAKFFLPTDSELVNGYLWVKAKISYLNLPSIEKEIKITINNDTIYSNDQKKADIIKNFIEKLIQGKIYNKSLNINVENLPIHGKIDGIAKEEIAKTQLSYIKQNLNVAIKDKVEYYDLNLNFDFSGDFSNDYKSTLFLMTNPTINNNFDKSIIFNGDINNIVIDFLVGNNGKSTLDTSDTKNNIANSIKIYQKFGDATTQISKIFSSWIVNPVKELPNFSEDFSEYKEKNNIKEQIITNGYFNKINKIYNILTLSQTWNENIIEIKNEKNNKFIFNNNQKSGYFNLNFNLTYDLKNIILDTNSKFNINVENIHIQLWKI